MTSEEPLPDHATRARLADAHELDDLGARELVARMLREDRVAVDAVAAESDAIARAVDGIAARLERGGRLIYVGAATSGRLGVVDAAECAPFFGTPPGLVVALLAGGNGAFTRAVDGASEDAELGTEAVRALGISGVDSVVGSSATGRTPYVLGALAYAKAAGALTVGLSFLPGSAVAEAAQIPITPRVGPEVLRGAARLKAGTATKLVLQALSTGAMVRSGRTFGDLVVELDARSGATDARRRHVVALATGIDEAAAQAALDAANGEVKTAIVGQLLGIDAADARQRLRRHGGRVAAVMAAVSD